MRVGKSVSKTIDEWEAGDFESAMLHACNAIDGTAKKKAYGSIGNKARFIRLIRENLDILGPMGMPGIDLIETVFPIDLNNSGQITPMGIADVIYRVHRCTQGHGDELPQGFELIPNAAGQPRLTNIIITRGKIKLSDRILFALVAVVVCTPENKGEKTDGDYFLTLNDGPPMIINQWWGWRDHLAEILASVEMPSVKLDFGDWLPSQSS